MLTIFTGEMISGIFLKKKNLGDEGENEYERRMAMCQQLLKHGERYMRLLYNTIVSTFTYTLQFL